MQCAYVPKVDWLSTHNALRTVAQSCNKLRADSQLQLLSSFTDMQTRKSCSRAVSLARMQLPYFVVRASYRSL